MKIFFPKESDKETRSALDLASAKRLIDLGIEVSFESGVTQKIDIADQDLEDIGCKNKSIKILSIQREGKKIQNINEFVLGTKIKKGTCII